MAASLTAIQRLLPQPRCGRTGLRPVGERLGEVPIHRAVDGFAPETACRGSDPRQWPHPNCGVALLPTAVAKLLVGDLNARSTALGCRSSNSNGAILEAFPDSSEVAVLNDALSTMHPGPSLTA